jgi:hypothetical protein
MSKLSSWLAIAFFTFLGATPALAVSPVTFVSGKGTNSGTCASPASPCRTFQFALGQTSPGGEIKALDPAHYGGVTITNSISITGVEGAGIDLDTATDATTAVKTGAITINAGADDTINLSHLTLDGLKTARGGIVLNSGGSLTISHCTVRNFEFGIFLRPTGNTAFLIADVTSSDNRVAGIEVLAEGTGSARGTLDHVTANKNGNGIEVSGATVLAVNSTAADNDVTGFNVGDVGTVLRLAHSAATGNGTGFFVGAGTAESAGNNFIRGNGVNVFQGPLTKIGTQ